MTMINYVHEEDLDFYEAALDTLESMPDPDLLFLIDDEEEEEEEEGWGSFDSVYPDFDLFKLVANKTFSKKWAGEVFEIMYKQQVYRDDAAGLLHTKFNGVSLKTAALHFKNYEILDFLISFEYTEFTKEELQKIKKRAL